MSQSTYSPSERETLVSVLDAIIPESPDASLPGAGALGLADLRYQVKRAGLEMEIEGVPEHARRALRSAGIELNDRPED